MLTKVSMVYILFLLPLTDRRIWHDNHDICVVRQHIDECSEGATLDFHALEMGLRPAMNGYESSKCTTVRKYRKHSHLHPRLNCLMILLIFSKRWASIWLILAALAITRKVDRSNRTTSSASHMEQKLLRWDSNVRILGIKACTMVDHACVTRMSNDWY